MSLSAFGKKIFVYDKKLRTPIADAYIEDFYGKILSYTDENGTGVVNIRQFTIKHISYNDVFVDLNLLQSDTVLMQPSVATLEDVEVVKKYNVLRIFKVKGVRKNKRIHEIMGMSQFPVVLSKVAIDTGIRKFRIKSITPHFYSTNEAPKSSNAELSVTVYEDHPMADSILPELIPLSETVTKSVKELRKNPVYKIHTPVIVNRSANVLILFRTSVKDTWTDFRAIHIRMNINIDEQRTFIVNKRRNGFLHKENWELIMDIEIEEVE